MKHFAHLSDTFHPRQPLQHIRESDSYVKETHGSQTLLTGLTYLLYHVQQEMYKNRCGAALVLCSLLYVRYHFNLLFEGLNSSMLVP